jgi:regulator of protease activity HflC (stomatin/prohibitin superfamily)
MFTYSRPGTEFIIKDTHRGLRYEDGKLTRILEAGKYKIPHRLWPFKGKKVEVESIDMRERDLTIKGQEILTADKVAIRVSILVQFCVIDPQAALHRVANYEERLYSDVQLAARRSLASMPLDEILTNRNRLSEDILQDVKEAAAGYGVAIRRADVKDLIFPGNLQEIMNRVLAAERNSEAQLVEARTRAEVERLEAATRAESVQRNAEAEAEARRTRERAEAEAAALRAETEAKVYVERKGAAEMLAAHPALLRLEELQALRDLARNGNARIYLGFGSNGLEVSKDRD